MEILGVSKFQATSRPLIHNLSMSKTEKN